MNLEKDAVYSAGDLARIGCVGRATALRWLNDDKVKHFKLPSGQFRIELEDLITFLKEHSMPIPKNLLLARKFNFLLIEDDLEYLELLKSQFELVEDINYEITYATSGLEGVLKIGQLEPDIVTIDMKMPGTNGDQILKQLHESNSIDKDKVIIITGIKNDTLFAELRSMGYKHFLLKPYPIDDFIEIVTMCVAAKG